MRALDRFGWKDTAEYYRFLRETDKEIGAFLSFSDREGDYSGKGLLQGLPFAVKDNIAVEGLPLSCGSKMLKSFISPYSASVITKLENAGAFVVGKTSMDEFGMGSSTETSPLGSCSNPWDRERVAGGSSGGSAAAVAAGMVPFALGSDTGGSVRQPASFCGTYGLKPSYGVLSRYGLVAYASSLESIGIMSLDTKILRQVFDCTRGIDSMDNASCSFPRQRKQQNQGKSIAVLSDLEGLSPQCQQAYRQALESLEELGFRCKKVEIPLLDYALPAYYTIASAEASANLARYSGIRYGLSDDLADDHEQLSLYSRNRGLGEEVKLRILLGTYVLRSGFQEQYYHRAQKIRTLIQKEFSKLFHDIDLFLSPVYPVPPFKKGSGGLDPFQQKLADTFTVSANLAGIPALAIPAGKAEGLPFGIQLMGPRYSEHQLIDAAELMARHWEPTPAPAYRRWS